MARRGLTRLVAALRGWAQQNDGAIENFELIANDAAGGHQGSKDRVQPIIIAAELCNAGHEG